MFVVAGGELKDMHAQLWKLSSLQRRRLNLTPNLPTTVRVCCCCQVCCVGLGLIRLLAGQLHLDIHQLDEPPLPAAAASNILTIHRCVVAVGACLFVFWVWHVCVFVSRCVAASTCQGAVSVLTRTCTPLTPPMFRFVHCL